MWALSSLTEKILAGISAVLLVVSLVSGAALYFTNVKLKVARADAIESQAFLAVQNAQIQEYKRLGDVAQAKAKDADAQATVVRKKYDKLAQQIQARPAPKGCEEARVYGLELAAEIAGGEE